MASHRNNNQSLRLRGAAGEEGAIDEQAVIQGEIKLPKAFASRSCP